VAQEGRKRKPEHSWLRQTKGIVMPAALPGLIGDYMMNATSLLANVVAEGNFARALGDHKPVVRSALNKSSPSRNRILYT